MHIFDVISSVSRFSKCTKIVGGWGFAPDPTGGAYSASPDLLARFKGATSKGRRGDRKKGEETEGRRGKGRGRQKLSRRHWLCRSTLLQNALGATVYVSIRQSTSHKSFLSQSSNYITHRTVFTDTQIALSFMCGRWIQLLVLTTFLPYHN